MNNLALIDKEYKSILEKRGMLPNDMGSEISESWARCISNGLDPFKGLKKSVISSQQLDQIREEKKDLRKIVIPELELLYSQVAGTNFMVAFSDNEGLVLDTIYDKTCLQTDVGKSVIPGSIWAEKICGTNGLGLAVEIKKPTIVSGKEHFFTDHEKLSCFASPIKNYDGKIIGIIDASTDARSREQHTLALVNLATRSIETKLFINKFSNELVEFFRIKGWSLVDCRDVSNLVNYFGKYDSIHRHGDMSKLQNWFGEAKRSDDHAHLVEKFFDVRKSVQKTRLGVCELTPECSITEAMKVFQLINSSGVQLSEIEVMASWPDWGSAWVYTSKTPAPLHLADSVKKMYQETKEMKGIDFDQISKWDIAATLSARLNHQTIWGE